jgi:ectoine hydroxylase-related dioxygenase (phytanoyl-CoA dioxygenase family)
VPVDTGTDWHQDGAFLGDDIRTVNVWLTLTDCGEDAPGLDVVAKRLPGVLETGTKGAQFDWSVGPDLVAEVAPNDVVRPPFRAGDALLFDQRNLHRTGVSPGMVRERYAVETWFFAPSSYPHDQIPIVF